MIYKKVFLITLLNSWLMLTIASEPKEGIRQLWLEYFLSLSISERADVGLLINNLYDSHFGLYDYFAEAYFKFNFDQVLSAELLYRQEYFKAGENWFMENRPALRLTINQEIGIWNFRYRNRIELRLINNWNKRWRYRSDILIEPTISLLSFPIKPYILEEIFISNSQISRIRSYLGVKKVFNKIEPSVYLLLQSDNSNLLKKNTLIGGVAIGICL